MKIIISDCSAASAMFLRDTIDSCSINEAVHIKFSSPGSSDVIYPTDLKSTYEENHSKLEEAWEKVCVE